MRLDKMLADTGRCTRKEAGKAVLSGNVKVNGLEVKDRSYNVDPEKDDVMFCGERIVYRRFTYIMLNKPQGVVSATNDPMERTVLDLLPSELKRQGLFPCGRLDKNTEGLLILTNNGPLSHFLLSPKFHVQKRYYFTVERPLSLSDIQKLESGVDIGGYVTMPSKVDMISEREGYITISEGKYHQIKLMLAALSNRVTFLKRVSFGPIILDQGLECGEYRHLTKDEVSALNECVLK